MVMNQEKETQADQLQQLFEEITQNEHVQEDNHDDEELAVLADNYDNKIDILDLPPRSEVHSSQSRWMKINFNRALLRFILIIGLVIGIVIGIYYLVGIEQLFT